MSVFTPKKLQSAGARLWLAHVDGPCVESLLHTPSPPRFSLTLLLSSVFANLSLYCMSTRELAKVICKGSSVHYQ